LGVGGPDLTTVGVDLFGAGPHVLLVSGPPGSGRTTAAATIVAGLRRAGFGILAVAPTASPMPTLLPLDAGVRVLHSAEFKDTDLREAADTFGDGPYAVVVDDVEQVTLSPTQEGFMELPLLVEEIARPAGLGQRALVLCGDASVIIGGARRSLTRVVTEAGATGTRLLLTPTSRPGAHTLGIELEADQLFAGPPGRGYLTTGPSCALIQLAVRDG
jgi:S-DNA-T family DNA segregation ATPase FtsK/SpoIIIE